MRMSTLAPLLLALAAPAAGAAEPVPMPPRFGAAESPRELLLQYPLGRLDRQAAFSHHGEASRRVKLPNGLTGWTYDVSPDMDTVTFVHPTGSEEQVNVPELGTATASFTLVLDARGRVVDVLYAEAGGDNRMSALQEQRWQGSD